MEYNSNREAHDLDLLLTLTSDPALQAAVEALREGTTDVDELSDVFAAIAENYSINPDELNTAIALLAANEDGEKA